MDIMETIPELRTITQKTRQTAIYRMNWFDRNILRRASIYITRLCIPLRIDPNVITGFDFLLVLGSGVCFLFPHPRLWLLGLALFLAYLLVDCVDGEVARYLEYKGTRKPQPLGRGSFLGGCVDAFVWPFVFACMGFGLYQATGSAWSFAAGFVAVIMRSLYMDLGIIVYPILHDYDRLADLRSSTATIGEPWFMGLGRLVFGVQGFIPAVLIVIILDWTLGSQFRLFYLSLFGAGATVGVIARIVSVYKHGVRVQRI